MNKALPPKKPTILIVDDDRLILATLSKGLQQAGYHILQAASGLDALQVIKQQEPDLAVLDIRMPHMSGMELALHLRDHTTIPFMFFSAYSDIDIARQAAEYGAVGYLVKPIDTAQIIPAIEAALARAAEIKALRRSEADLTAALAAGRETSMAIGVLMERFHLDRDAAFETLRTYARANRRKINDVAAELLKAEELLNLLQPETPKAS